MSTTRNANCGRILLVERSTMLGQPLAMPTVSGSGIISPIILHHLGKIFGTWTTMMTNIDLLLCYQPLTIMRHMEVKMCLSWPRVHGRICLLEFMRRATFVKLLNTQPDGADLQRRNNYLTIRPHPCLTTSLFLHFWPAGPVM